MNQWLFWRPLNMFLWLNFTICGSLVKLKPRELIWERGKIFQYNAKELRCFSQEIRDWERVEICNANSDWLIVTAQTVLLRGLLSTSVSLVICLISNLFRKRDGEGICTMSNQLVYSKAWIRQGTSMKLFCFLPIVAFNHSVSVFPSLLLQTSK